MLKTTKRFDLSPSPIYLVERLLQEFRAVLRIDDLPFDATATLFNHKARVWHFANLTKATHGSTANCKYLYQQKLLKSKNCELTRQKISNFITTTSNFIDAELTGNVNRKALTEERFKKLRKRLKKLEESIAGKVIDLENLDNQVLSIYSCLPIRFYDLIPGIFCYLSEIKEDFKKLLLNTSGALVTTGGKRLAELVLKFTGTDETKTFPGKQTFEDSLFKDLIPIFYETEQKPPTSLILPIWDIWINGRGFGAFAGFVFIEAANLKPDKWNDAPKILSNLWDLWQTSSHFVLDRLEILSAELYRSSLARISTYRIGQRDFFDIFIEAISEVQSWDYVAIMRDNKPLRTFSFCSDESAIIECKNIGAVNLSAPYLRWTKEYWDREFVQVLIGSETEWLDFEILFYYPPFVLVPPDENDPGSGVTSLKEAFENVLIEQQMEIFRILLPIYRTQRAAQRIAISAIMGRNMSHNIGSHVLSNLSAKFEEVLKQEKEANKIDPRAEFIAFLQQRMDFSASVATGSESFWSESLSLKESLVFYDRDSALNKHWVNEGEAVKNPLLEFIAGNSKLVAGVKFISKEDIRFSCAGGRVGIHGFYIMLENIIRNSARHGLHIADGEDILVVEVLVIATLLPEDQLVKIELLDSKFDSQKTSKIDEINKIFTFGAGTVDHNAELYDLLAKDGSPNPKNWGLREMQICAHVLRGWSLDDIGQDDSAFPLIRAEAKNGTLTYTIYVPMEKTLAIVGNQKKTQLGLKDGIKWITPRTDPKYSVAQVRNYIASEANGYDFLVTDCDKTLNVETRNQFPVRSFCMCGEDYLDVLKALQSTSNEAIKELLMGKVKYLYAEKHGSKLIRHVFWSQDPVILNICKNWEVKAVPSPKDKIKYESDYLTIGRIDHPRFNYNNIQKSPEIKQLFDGKDNGDFNWACLEGVFHASTQYSDITRSMSSSLEYTAAALASVVIIDERIQSAGTQKGTRWAHDQYYLWRSMNVWVPDEIEINLNSPNFGCIEDFKNLRNFILNNINRDRQKKLSPPDFLLFHLTLLEKFCATLKLHELTQWISKESANEDIEPTLAQLLEALVTEELGSGMSTTDGGRPRRILISGRGVSTGSKNDFRFLPFSAVSSSLLGQCDKLRLVRTLWSASLPN